MFSQPVRASVCALYCALSACSDNTSAGKTDKPAPPKYSVDRPVEGLPPPVPRDDSFKRGVSLDLFIGEVNDAQRAVYGDWLTQVAQLGATDLELVVQWSQLDQGSVELAPNATATVGDDFLAWLMDQANARQLRVMLTPVIEVEASPRVSEQRLGQPGTEHRAIVPSDPARWFWSYHRFALHYARIAEAHKATCFAVGADLPLALASDPHWVNIIRDVRKAYKGKLTYVARPDKLESLSMWGALDVISVTATGEPVSAVEARGPARDPAKLGLGALTQRLQAFAKSSSKPYQLTSVHPGAGKSRTVLEQLDAARALYQTLHGQTTLSGLFVTLVRPGVAAGKHDAPEVSSPYAAVLRHWYTRPKTN